MVDVVGIGCFEVNHNILEKDEILKHVRDEGFQKRRKSN